MFKDKPIETRKALVKAMVLRMAKAYGVEKRALPKHLGINKNVINNWRYYGRIPFDHLYHCHQVTGTSMDWLLHGETPPMQMSGPHIQQLTELTHKLFADGVGFNMISENYPGALKQLTGKFDKDIEQWLAGLKDETRLE